MNEHLEHGRFALLSAFLLTLGCESGPPRAVADTESDDAWEETTGDEVEDGGSESSGASRDDDPGDLAAELDPSKAWVDHVGGLGGTPTTGFCPSGFSAIGVGASSTGNYVRQLVLLCGPDVLIEDGIEASSSSQYVLSSGYYNPGYQGAGAALVSSYSNWRPVWEELDAWWMGAGRYKAPGTTFHECDPGYKLRSLNVRAGTYVDNIVNARCLWDGPGSGPRGVIYTLPINVGGSGGAADVSECWTPGSGGPFAYAIHFRSGYWLDGFALNCKPG